MSFLLSTENTGVDRPLVPAGLQQAVLVHLIDYGTQTRTWEGQESKKREVRIGFIFPKHTIEIEGEEKPLMLSTWSTLSLHPKSKLHKIVTEMIGKSLPETFDISTLIGTNCMINVIHEEKNGEKRDKIASYAPLMPGMEVITPNETKLFNLDAPNKDAWEALGEKEQEKIKAAPEYQPFM